MNIFKLFKRKPTYKDFTIDNTVLNRKAVSYGDIFIKSGLHEYILNNYPGGKYHYKNIRANSSTINLLDTALETNLIKTKNKYSKFYKEKALKYMAAFDRLMYAPFVDETIPDNTLRMLLPNHKEFKSEGE